MTIEQLQKGNEISTKINRLKEFMEAFNDYRWSNTLVANHYKEQWGKTIQDKQYLCLDDYPELNFKIGNYISEEIGKLKKQLEEL